MRILVIDDDFVSRIKLKSLLERYGDCDVSPGGEEGIELFRAAHAQGSPYSLVTVDVEMPGMAGQEVVRWIRDYERVGATCDEGVRILMVSIYDDHNVWTSFREGCDGYLVKPTRTEDVDSSMRELGFTLN